ncbi:uncharacterized protein JCM6883_000157 [Sporobolomyces salmoneus]|uniref:uncharacterized protein n=1 Tax=Sporobolomyces salmoneus TaxID=183962 RepID=UPI003174028B
MVKTVELLLLLLLCGQGVVAQDNVPAREVWRRRWLAGKRSIWGQGNNAHLVKKQLATSFIRSSTSTSTAIPTSVVAASSGAEDIVSSSTSSILSDSTSSTPSGTPTVSTTQTSAPSVSAYTGHRSQALAGALTTSSSSTIAPAYTGGSFTISGTGTLPTPSAFVTKVARTQQLTVNGKPYKIVGPNIYWLCQDENYGPVGSYADKRRVREALAAAVAMGATTIRAHSCGISVGPNNPYQLEPSWNKFNDAAWDSRDYAIYAAGRYGLRVILPLIDNWKYYHGSKYDFIKFRFANTSYPGDAFYGNRAVVGAFGSYIQKVVSRVNPYTGLSYAQDPTILAWETGNELGGYINAEPWPTTYFTTQVIQYIRKFDKNHLILDGTNGFYNYTNKATPPSLTNRGIGMVSDHAYPRNVALFNAQVPLAANSLKNFLVGEWDWTNSFGGSSVDDFIAALEATPTVGDMIWSYFGRTPDCSSWVTHNDGYSLYYPNGPNNAAERANILKVVQHWYRVTGRPIPDSLPDVACPQPEF